MMEMTKQEFELCVDIFSGKYEFKIHRSKYTSQPFLWLLRGDEIMIQGDLVSGEYTLYNESDIKDFVLDLRNKSPDDCDLKQFAYNYIL